MRSDMQLLELLSAATSTGFTADNEAEFEWAYQEGLIDRETRRLTSDALQKISVELQVWEFEQRIKQCSTPLPSRSLASIRPVISNLALVLQRSQDETTRVNPCWLKLCVTRFSELRRSVMTRHP